MQREEPRPEVVGFASFVQSAGIQVMAEGKMEPVVVPQE